MKILHVIPSLAPCHGGPSVVLPIMERALTREGIEVTTVATDDDGPGRRNDKGDGAVREENGVIRRYFPKQTEFYKVSLPLARWMRARVKDYDVVHVHALFSHASNAAARAALRAGVPYIIRPLGLLNHYGMTRRRATLKRWSLRYIEGPLLRDAAAVHFTLDAERKEAEMLEISFHSAVIPLGIEDMSCSDTSIATRQFVLFLSRIDPKKNIDSLIEAWAQLGGFREAWKLVIAGAGEDAYVRSLQSHAQRCGVDASIEWAGQVAGERKARLLSEAAIYALPSFSENFGIAAAEAMLAGKPCLFSPGVAVGSEAAQQGAALLAGPDAGSLASGLRELMANEKRRRDLAMAARRFAETELSAAVMGRRLKELYESLTETSHAAG